MPLPMINLNIRRIAIHQVFERTETGDIRPPRYNSILTQLSEEGLNTLCQRVTDALGNNSHSIDMNIIRAEENSTFQILVRMIYEEDAQFLNMSKIIADKLAQCQANRRIPGGILVVFDGTVGNNNLKFIAVIKAESQAGFALEAANSTEILLRYISELLLTPQQKLYKIGMFVEKEPIEDGTDMRSADEFYAVVYDQNMNNTETRNAALYFYKSFLGCAPHESSKKLTREFYTYTKDFINDLNVSDEVKVDLHNSLYDYLKMSRETTISVNDFASRYFEPEVIDNYTLFMRNKSFPANAVYKDIEYIKPKLRRRQIRFTSKVKIIAPSEDFGNLVHIVEQDETGTTIKIQGKIEEQ